MRRKHTDHAGASRVALPGGHNPLVRRSDRIQSRVKSVVVAFVILMIPLAVWFGVTTHSTQQARVLDEQSSRHAVTAVTTADAAAGSALVQSDFSTQSSTTVDATWTYRGVEHRDRISVATAAPAGTQVPIWVDDAGTRSTQPVSNGDAMAAALFTGIGSFLAVSLLLFGIYSATRFQLDAARDAEWDLAIKNFMDENSLS